jgi:hypothetical protein
VVPGTFMAVDQAAARSSCSPMRTAAAAQGLRRVVAAAMPAPAITLKALVEDTLSTCQHFAKAHLEPL